MNAKAVHKVTVSFTDERMNETPIFPLLWGTRDISRKDDGFVACAPIFHRLEVNPVRGNNDPRLQAAVKFHLHGCLAAVADTELPAVDMQESRFGIVSGGARDNAVCIQILREFTRNIHRATEYHIHRALGVGGHPCFIQRFDLLEMQALGIRRVGHNPRAITGFHRVFATDADRC